MIIAFLGKMGSGKDSSADALCADNPSWKRISFAAALKRVAYDTNPALGSGELTLSDVVDDYGWEWAKLNVPEVRRLLQALGVACRDHVDPDVWVNAALRQMEPGRNHTVTDCRFPNEYDALKALGAKFIRITRPGYEGDNHISETALDGYPVDLTIDNCSHLEDLAEWVLAAVDTFLVRERGDL